MVHQHLRTIVVACALCLGGALPASAAPVVVDFDNLLPDYLPEAALWNWTHFEDGFTVFSSQSHLINSELSGASLTPHSSDWLLDDGFTPIEISRTDGSAFSAISFEFGAWSRTTEARSVEVIGIAPDGTAYSQLFTSDLFVGLQTLALGEGFGNLLKFSVRAPSANVAFDSFAFAEPTSVPEPSSLLLLALGATLVFAGRTRPRSRRIGQF